MIAWASKKTLTFFGWKVVGSPPDIKKYVVIVAPHTSNWDFFIFLLLKFTYKIKINFIGKHTIFLGPIGWLLKKIGGIPVNRSHSHNVVDSIIKAFDDNENMIFALSPEGTRSYKDHWKSGFYYIALKAKVPLQTCFLDMNTKTLGFGPLLHLSGDMKKDLCDLQNIYSDKKGIKPELFSKIIFKSKS